MVKEKMTKIARYVSQNAVLAGVLAFVLVTAFAGTIYAATWISSNVSGVGGDAFNVEGSSEVHALRSGGADHEEDGFRITNNSQNNFFVPNKTAAEFNSFKNNTPSGIEICQPVDGGFSGWAYNGGYWSCTNRGSFYSKCLYYRYTRSCNNPAPSCDGDPCSGSSSKVDSTGTCTGVYGDSRCLSPIRPGV